jgi:hypothetical protein
MRNPKNLLRMAAGVCVMGLAACGTERDAAPAPETPPAYEELAPRSPRLDVPQEPQRNGHPGAPDGSLRTPPADESAPRLERGLDPLDFEADLRPRQRRNPVWVAIA